MMNETCLKLAENAEKKLEKIYISVTVEAFVVDATLVGVILYYLRMTAFTVMQAIGATLLILVIASLVLLLRKRKLKKQLIAELEQNESSEELFKKYLEENALEFELLRSLFIQVPVKHGKG